MRVSVWISVITWRLAAVRVDVFTESEDDRVCLIVTRAAAPGN